LIIEKGVIGETYCLGGLTKDISNLDVVKMIIKIMNKGEEFIQYVKDRPGHDVRYTIDWSKANRQLGYKPAYTFEQYLQQTIAWYTEHKDWWKRVKSGAYQDYYQKQYDER